MSGQFPTSPVARSANITSQQDTIVSVTTSGRKQARQIDGQRFAITLTFPPMSRAEFAPIKAFVMKQRSQLENFTLIPPTENSSQGSVNETVRVDGAVSAGATTFSIQDVGVNSVNGFFKAGDYFRFSGQNKVYMIIEDVNINAVGEATTITFEPPLRSSVSDTTEIIYDNVDFTVSLTNDIQEFSIGTTNYYTYEIDVVEVL